MQTLVTCSTMRLLGTFQKIIIVPIAKIHCDRNLCQGYKRLQSNQNERHGMLPKDNWNRFTYFTHNEIVRRLCTKSPNTEGEVLSTVLKNQADVKTTEFSQNKKKDEQVPTPNILNVDQTQTTKSKESTSIPKAFPNPFVFKPASIDIDYNITYTRNTFISASRAIGDYFLTHDDLENLRKTKVRTAYNDSDLPPDYCYLKQDVEERALEIWGSLEALKRERQQRQAAMETGERTRKELSVLFGHLKKSRKDQSRKKQDNEVFGSNNERILVLQGSAKVVFIAVVTNSIVTLFKFSAYLYTGSASMMSEAIHSVTDLANQCVLFYGIKKSIKEPSPDHPYGWSNALYAYSLISAVGIFCFGGGYSIYHGITELLNPTPLHSLSLAYAVLGLSTIVEGYTLFVAYKQVKKSARESGLTFKEYLFCGRDPSAVAVFLEDLAAVIGLFIAGGSIGLSSYLENPMFDAMGSIGVGALIGWVSIFLIRRNLDALTTRSMPPDRLRQIYEVLENDIMVMSIHDVKATDMGANSVRFKAEINFDGREVTRVVINRLDLEHVIKEVQQIKTTDQLEKFLLDHGDIVIDALGSQVDRIEKNIKKKLPEVRHVDLEIL